MLEMIGQNVKIEVFVDVSYFLNTNSMQFREAEISSTYFGRNR